jgi:hypothetical protein
MAVSVFEQVCAYLNSLLQLERRDHALGQQWSRQMRIGLVVNPIAGLGGRVGLKGTDGPDTVAQAMRAGRAAAGGARAPRARWRGWPSVCRGQRLVAAPRTAWHGLDRWPGPCGGRSGSTVETDSRTARDTRLAVAAMGDCDLILFAGGDGTARDVAGAELAPGQAMLGIPCGVKMHSGVFAVSPEAAGALVAELVEAPERIAWER